MIKFYKKQKSFLFIQQGADQFGSIVADRGRRVGKIEE
jgi:hypothetical protein